MFRSIALIASAATITVAACAFIFAFVLFSAGCTSPTAPVQMYYIDALHQAAETALNSEPPLQCVPFTYLVGTQGGATKTDTLCLSESAWRFVLGTRDRLRLGVMPAGDRYAITVSNLACSGEVWWALGQWHWRFPCTQGLGNE